jgi:hypothetical protein
MGLRTVVSAGVIWAVFSGIGPATAAGQMFCCADEHGKQVCGDILPQACYGRAYRELGSSGRTLRNVDAPLTAEQRAQRAIEDERRKEREAALKEQKLKDQALLDTYGTEKDLETLRRRAEQDINSTIQAAENKIAEAHKQRKRFENEAEFYKKKQLPLDVDKGLRDADAEIGAQVAVITARKKDMEAIRIKFDEDLRRFRELTRRTTPAGQ